MATPMESFFRTFEQLSDETVLDDRSSLVRTEWHWRFERSVETLVELTLPSSYVVERSPDRWQIVAYIPHADIMAELRRRGLVPAGA